MNSDSVSLVKRDIAKNKSPGRPVDAQFAHVWRVQDGKIRAFQQYTDTAQFVAAVTP